MTDQGVFECIKRDLTDDVVGRIMEARGLSEDDAIRSFMRSEVYDRLQNQETDVWHYSRRVLFELYMDEMEGELVWPEC